MARAALIVTLAALTGAGTALSSAKPSLRVQSKGAVVVGSHFRAGEMVTVTLVTGTGARKARVRAAAGVFRVGFRVPAQGCGAAYAVSARGASGRRPPSFSPTRRSACPAPGLRRWPAAISRGDRSAHARARPSLLLLRCRLGATPSGGVRGGGVQGTVEQAAGGACLADDPCDGIGRNLGLVFSRAGNRLTGAFQRQRRLRVLLAPGRYTVRAVAEPARRVSPSHVTVPRRIRPGDARGRRCGAPHVDSGPLTPG